ncbi:MAG: HesA/MoeB/ThiF family protein [Candidatus Geothermincolia bacterium]
MLSRIEAAAYEQVCPDGVCRRVISLDNIRELAGGGGHGVNGLEQKALEAGIIPSRYLRNIGTLGLEGQLRLLRSTVAVFGLGGLGGLQSELLARMGVGRLILVDGDVFSEDNLNRQVLSNEKCIGKPKTDAAAARLNEVNSGVGVELIRARVDSDRMFELLEGVDVALDALDSIDSRYDLQEACRRAGKPFVHGAIAGSVGQVMTVLPGDAGLDVLYAGASGGGIETATGNPATTPALVASLQVQEALKLLTGKGDLLRQRFLFIDTENNLYEVIPAT